MRVRPMTEDRRRMAEIRS